MHSGKNVYIKTYGCQMNFYDSERMEEILGDVGIKRTDVMAEADVIILNTCHIREKASEKVFSELGRVKQIKDERLKNGNKTIIAVAGCVAQAEGDEITKRASYVDVVLGPESYHHLPDLVFSILRGGKAITSLDFKPEEKFDTLKTERKAKGFSAFVTIQEGCDKFCTFCVVPYTRGAEFSRPVKSILEEITSLCQNGVVEVTLLGQNVNAYHGIGEEGKEISLAGLIRLVSHIPQIKRIRFVTSHPNNVTDDLINEYAENPKLMPYLHLPIQSGSNSILKAMNRKHTREHYFNLIEKFKKARPDICLSSDFIVAFPEETEEDFNQTLDAVEKVFFPQSYSFKYSPRPGTPASLKEMVTEDVADARLQKLQKLLAKQQKEYNASFIGKKIEVLFENPSPKATSSFNQITGKSPYLQAVSVLLGQEERLENYLGKIFQVEITEAKENTLVGVICSPLPL
jgi:tRNA-2-methylthio-N6-dimethylallyladenosine synthase